MVQHVIQIVMRTVVYGMSNCPHPNLYYMLYHELFPACSLMQQQCQMCDELFKCNIVLSPQHASKHWEIYDNSYVVVT